MNHPYTPIPSTYESSLYSCHINQTVPKDILNPRLVFHLNVSENVGAKYRQSCQNTGFLCDNDIAFPFFKNARFKRYFLFVTVPK